MVICIIWFNVDCLRMFMKKFVCLLVFIISLIVCLFKIVYNNVDWWIYWYFDDYVELIDE